MKNPIEELIYLFSKLPGLGQRSSRRIVLHLLQDKEIRLKSLLESLQKTAGAINKCEICSNIDLKHICNICASSLRDDKTIAIVETVAELWALERSGNFKGKYHVLGSALSAGNNQNPIELRLPELLERCKMDNVSEIIIATNSTMPGQTTAYFITEYFKNSGVKISRLASGIPIGGELEYLDEGTLTAALNLRQLF
jgi:recombination protein RecR